MKRILSLAIAAVMCLALFAGCNSATPGASGSAGGASPSTSPGDTVSSDPSATEPDNGNDEITIAVSLNSADQYRTSWLDKFKTLAASKGYKVIDTNADSDASKQISDIESLMLQNPDVLIVHPYSGEGVVPGTDAAFDSGLPVIVIDSPVESDKFTSHIMDRQGLNGVIQAEYVQSWLAEDSSREANIGYIVGMYSMEAAMPRRDEFYQTLGITEAMAEAEANWSGGTAMSITEDWIQAHPTMNVFACMSDEIAIGCIQALKAANKNMDEVLVLGVDGSAEAMEYLRSGDLDCTAARNIDIEVAVAMETAEKIYRGESVEKEIEPNAIYALTKDDVE